jgi:hypothetical protein
MTSDRAIDAYLDQVTAALAGPPRAHADITAELRTGLLDAAEAHRHAGLPAVTATEAAVNEFGDPRQLAAAFLPELTARQARRLAFTLVAAGTASGLAWAHAAQASDTGFRPGWTWKWLSAPPVPLAAAAFLIAILAALVVVATAGPLTRWLPDRPRIAAVAAATGGSAAADLAILALLAIQLSTANDTLAPVPVAVAAIASLTRLAVAHRTALSCAHIAHTW